MGYSRSDEDFRADHARDHAKHDFEPIDRLETKIPTAVEIAHLVKSVDIMAGAGLIEQYARTFALEGQVEGTKQAYDRLDALLAKPVLP